MKYIKILFGIVIGFWLVTMIMGSRIRPGSWFFPVRVNLNEPLWVWVHITAPGRAGALEGVLDTRYTELEHAWYARDAEQIVAAKEALIETHDVVMAAVHGYTFSGDYTVADSLASFAIGRGRIHGQVLEALVAGTAVTQTSADVVFVRGAVAALQAARVEAIKKFAVAYSKDDLVRGIDAQLSRTRDMQDAVQGEFDDASSLLQAEQKSVLSNMLASTKTGYEEAKRKLEIDQYVESFVQANTVQARLSEVRVAVRATKAFGVPVIPLETVE